MVQVGQAGVTGQVTEAVDAALLDHELIKVRMVRPADKKAMAAELAERAFASLCGVVGHMAILYRPHPDKPQIKLPATRSVPKVGRNDACPCGSGKKYKQCCGR